MGSSVSWPELDPMAGVAGAGDLLTGLATASEMPDPPTGLSAPWAEIAVGVRQVAASHGFVAAGAPMKRGAGGSFDHALTAQIDALVPSLSLHEAYLDEPWEYLALVCLPDVVWWRWRSASATDKETGEARISSDRLLMATPVRHALARHWIRSRVVGADLCLLATEDELVGVLERPSLGANPVLAGAILGAHLNILDHPELRSAQPPSVGTNLREKVFRDAMKRLGRLNVICVLNSLDKEAAHERATAVLLESWAAFGAAGA